MENCFKFPIVWLLFRRRAAASQTVLTHPNYCNMGVNNDSHDYATINEDNIIKNGKAEAGIEMEVGPYESADVVKHNLYDQNII